MQFNHCYNHCRPTQQAKLNFHKTVIIIVLDTFTDNKAKKSIAISNAIILFTFFD